MLTTPGARQRPRNKIQYMLPLGLGLVILIWFISSPESFYQNFGLIMIIYITGAFIGTFGLYFYRKTKYRNLRKQHICPYCKKQNPPDLTQCKYCLYPMDEQY